MTLCLVQERWIYWDGNHEGFIEGEDVKTGYDTIIKWADLFIHLGNEVYSEGAIGLNIDTI
jgi:hypothetical protein